MKKIILLLLLCCSCAHKAPPQDHVTVETALKHIKSSYLLGCVEARKEVKLPKNFQGCVDKAQAHRESVEEVLDQFP